MTTTHIRYLLPGLLFFIFLSTLSSCRYSDTECMAMYEKAANEQFDMVIVPGIPSRDGHWNDTMKARIYWSKFLYDKGIARNIMYSGSSVYTPYNEAKVMALYAEALGIPREHIFTETRAEHSTENIYYSYHKAKQMGCMKIAVASDPMQTRMLAGFVEKLDTSIRMLPAVFSLIQTVNPDDVEPMVDCKGACNNQFVALPQRESWFKRFKGTLGFNIDTTLYR